MNAHNPEISDVNELARHELGSLCAEVIRHIDTLSLLIDDDHNLDITREEGVVSSLYPNIMSSNLTVDNIALTDGNEYCIGVLRSDDSSTPSDRGSFNLDDPKAYYRMTFRRVQNTPEGRVDLEAFSVEMARSTSRHSSGDANPSSLIIWNLDEPGEAEYLKGNQILDARQFNTIKELEKILAAEEDKAYARMLYQ